MCSHILTRKCTLKMPVTERTTLGPKLRKNLKPNQKSKTPKTLNSCSRNSQCLYFVQEQDSIYVEYFRAI